MRERKTEAHESYGMIGVVRGQSTNPQNLFGSSIQHRSTISIVIHSAEHVRDLSTDWYHAQRQLIEVEMSQAQFAEMITSPNIGDGVPCTIRRIDGKLMEEPPFESKKDIFNREFQEQMQKIVDEDTPYMQEALEILNNKSSITKGDRETIKSAISMLLQEVKSNLGFTYKQFQEQMDKTVQEAKAEVESFVETKVRSLGVDALRAQMPVIDEPRALNEKPV